ncbi:hypothetical protein [Thomasclavelia cocleata]|uniref:hypothetical protein n=1 Tax=Thomasclavelia cocleata TaxID=69824 RepID=UPI002570198F|nr:hypothetical protein [Thomasclavelia cocleata]
MKKIIFTLVAFVGLFVSLIFGFDSNASAFNQRLYYDTRQFQDGLTVFSDSMYTSYGSKAVTNLINLNSQNGNSSYVGATFTYSSAVAPKDFKFQYAFSASLDLSKSYFDLSEMSSDEKLYILVYESHNSEEYSFSRTDFSFNYNQDVDLVETGFNNYVDSYNVKYIQPILKSYSFVIFDISAYVSNLNVINGNAGYLSFYSRYSMIYDTVNDFNDNESLSFNYVVFSSLEQPVITTPIVRSAVNYIERKFPEDSFAYVDLTYNAQPKDYIDIYYKQPYNLGYQAGYDAGYEEGKKYVISGFNPFKNSTINIFNNLPDTGVFYEGKALDTTLSFSQINIENYFMSSSVVSGIAQTRFYLQFSRDFYVTSNDLRFTFSKPIDINISIGFLDGTTFDLTLLGDYVFHNINNGYYYFYLGDTYRSKVIDYIVFPELYWKGENDSRNVIPLIIDNMTSSFQIGYNTGFDKGNSHGYNTGYQSGYDIGYNEGKAYGYNEGFNKGYEQGAGGNNTLVGMIYAIVDAPFKVLKDSMNFNFLGINVADFIFSALTMIIVIKIFKFVFAK